MKEMVGGCCVCSDERGWPENPLVYCDGQNCTVAVHQACYGIVTVPTGPWFCRKCESQERSTRVRCELCPSRDGALKKTDNNGWAHVVCALYIPEVRFGNVTTMEPIILQLIPPERYSKACYICHDIGKPSRATVGACMQCNKSNCKQQFHVTCAQSLGLLCEEAGNYLDNVKYCGYCQHHYSKLKKGGNVKTIPPYKPISHDSSSDSSLSPEKEIETTATASSTSATSIKITTNASGGLSSSISSTSSSSKQRKSSSATSKQTSSSQSTAPSSSTSSSGNANNTGLNLSTNNSTGANTSLDNSSAGITSSSNPTKSSSSSSSSSKDKEKHNKSVSKTSSYSKDSSSSRDKSSKSSKSKDSSNLSISNLSSSSTSSSTSSTTGSAVQNLSSFIATTTAASSSVLANTFTEASNSSSSARDLSKNASNSSSTNPPVGTSDSHASQLNPSRDNTSDLAILQNINTNSNTSSAVFTSSNKNSNSNSSSTVTKKRKAEGRASSLTDDVTNSYRDIIKDVTVTLTPLQQTDFEKEIEKSSKRQKTELSPPTHQTVSVDSSNSQSNTSTLQAPNSSTTSSNTSSNPSTASSSISSNTSTFTTSTTSASSNSQSKTTNEHKSSSHKSSSKDSHRDERYGSGNVSATSPTSVANAHTTSSSNNNSNSTTASSLTSGNTPSLYVSVPLSTANVPGLNLPTTTNATASEQSSQSSRNATASQLFSTAMANAATAAATSISSSVTTSNVGGGSSSSGLLERQSPRINQQSPALNDNFTTSTSLSGSNNAMPSPATTVASSSASGSASSSQGGVIHQSGKVSSPAVLTSSATASPSESGSSSKMNYEKQTTRVSQLQEQETVSSRRSRTPDSGIFSSTSCFNSSSNSNLSNTSLNNGSLNTSSSGGLKFTYEAQPGVGVTTSIPAGPPIFDGSSLPSVTNIKDSPPSSPNSEMGTVRKRGRRTRDSSNTNTKDTTTSSTNNSSSANNNTNNSSSNIANDLKDIKVFQNGGGNAPPTTNSSANTLPSTVPNPLATITTIAHTTAPHMLGNQLNPTSSVAQKLSDQLHMEIQDHSVYTPDAPQFTGVPFPGRPRNSTSSLVSSNPNTASSGVGSLASMFGGCVNGNMALPQNLEQLLERQWEQGSQFLMEQAQHFDIASLLSCLHQLQTENVRLEEHVNSLIARRDHLLAVNARLAIPLNTNTTTQGKLGERQ